MALSEWRLAGFGSIEFACWLPRGLRGEDGEAGLGALIVLFRLPSAHGDGTEDDVGAG
jgi:hypothetical protein